MNDTMSGDCSKGVKLFEDDFGFFLDKTTGWQIPVRRFTWKNQNGIEVQVITYGATITTLKVPDRHGVVKDIVMGFDNMDGYLKPLNPYFGATIGRVANRIGGGKFKIDDQPYTVTKNKGTFTLHGGFIGFDKVVWNHDVQGKSVVFSYLSKDKEEGFPGNLLVNLKCELTDDNEFKMDVKAYTSKPTIVNLTNHSYFNLAGHNAGAQEVYNTVVQINSDKITAVDEEIIPTGGFIPIRGTIYDFQTPKLLKEVINKIPGGGFDHNYCVNMPSKNGVTFVARATHEASGRILEVYSNQPGVQFYTANFLPVNEPGNEQLTGKENCLYNRHGSFCFEAENYPDAVNHPNFPNEVLRPGQVYHNITYFVCPGGKNNNC